MDMSASFGYGSKVSWEHTKNVKGAILRYKFYRGKYTIIYKMGIM